ncbi:hypothetical protein C9374_003173 [Naegleria lovaniensis]|uniref:Uncharacterized protein n=1 Tax=Naegleria lovaniensis TaxID=51637 RepID=A0AA88GTV0_NAELO|nr:uncharacterized protein C9374_003173 [Naegleria lovaniensis]KAG2386024.1 hypothetical protein C9374_003173 [Naegleria lovaniensis]
MYCLQQQARFLFESNSTGDCLSLELTTDSTRTFCLSTTLIQDLSLFSNHPLPSNDSEFPLPLSLIALYNITFNFPQNLQTMKATFYNPLGIANTFNPDTVIHVWNPVMNSWSEHSQNGILQIQQVTTTSLILGVFARKFETVFGKFYQATSTSTRFQYTLELSQRIEVSFVKKVPTSNEIKPTIFKLEHVREISPKVYHPPSGYVTLHAFKYISASGVNDDNDEQQQRMSAQEMSKLWTFYFDRRQGFKDTTGKAMNVTLSSLTLVCVINSQKNVDVRPLVKNPLHTQLVEHQNKIVFDFKEENNEPPLHCEYHVLIVKPIVSNNEKWYGRNKEIELSTSHASEISSFGGKKLYKISVDGWDQVEFSMTSHLGYGIFRAFVDGIPSDLMYDVYAEINYETTKTVTVRNYKPQKSTVFVSITSTSSALSFTITTSKAPTSEGVALIKFIIGGMLLFMWIFMLLLKLTK